MVVRGPAQPINFSQDVPQPGPAHHVFFFQRIEPRLGPADRIFKNSRTGPAHGIGGEAHETRALHGPGHAPAHVLSRTNR